MCTKKKVCTKNNYFNLGITGATIKIDLHGDSEGNFSVLSLKPSTVNIAPGNFTCDLHLVPVAFFQQGINNTFPVSESSIFNFCLFYSLIFCIFLVHVLKII